MLACGCAIPSVGEQLPRIFAARGRVQRRRLPWPIVHADFDRLQRRPVIQHDAEHLVPAAVAGDARDERLQLHVGDRGLDPLHVAIDDLAPHGAVPPSLELAEVLFLLDVDLGEPFDVGHSVPSRNDEPER